MLAPFPFLPPKATAPAELKFTAHLSAASFCMAQNVGHSPKHLFNSFSRSSTNVYVVCALSHYSIAICIESLLLHLMPASSSLAYKPPLTHCAWAGLGMWQGWITLVCHGAFLPHGYVQNAQSADLARLSTAHRINDTIHRADLDTKNWVHLANNRDEWRKLCRAVKPKVEKRGRRPAAIPAPPATMPQPVLPPPPLPQRQRRPPSRLLATMQT